MKMSTESFEYKCYKLAATFLDNEDWFKQKSFDVRERHVKALANEIHGLIRRHIAGHLENPKRTMISPKLRYTFAVAGHIYDTLNFFPYPTGCGKIVDGVAMANGNTDVGGWVISYEDLKTMYELATQARRNMQ
jgi:hypothetical protein